MFGLVPVLFLRRTRQPSAALLITIAVTSGVVALVKALAGRVRPCYAVDWVRPVSAALPSDPSFPSGHAAGSFALAVFVFILNRRAGMLLLGVAAAIALSRVALGVHYPSDVAAGAILGSTLAWIGTRVNARYGGSPASV
jgi:undecaprenyl-diphosphatase